MNFLKICMINNKAPRGPEIPVNQLGKVALVDRFVTYLMGLINGWSPPLVIQIVKRFERSSNK